MSAIFCLKECKKLKNIYNIDNSNSAIIEEGRFKLQFSACFKIDLIYSKVFADESISYWCGPIQPVHGPSHDGRAHFKKQNLTRCNIRLLRSHIRLKKNRPYYHWLKSQGHYLLCFSTSKTVGANSVRLRNETRTRYS